MPHYVFRALIDAQNGPWPEGTHPVEALHARAVVFWAVRTTSEGSQSPQESGR